MTLSSVRLKTLQPASPRKFTSDILAIPGWDLPSWAAGNKIHPWAFELMNYVLLPITKAICRRPLPGPAGPRRGVSRSTSP